MAPRSSRALPRRAAEVASAVASSCAGSQPGCVEAIRLWVAAAAGCSDQDDQNEACVCTRQGLDIARGIGDAALSIRSADAALFAMISSAVTEGSPGCFAGAFAQIALRVEPDGGSVGSPG